MAKDQIQLDEELILAAASNKPAEVQRLLKEGASANALNIERRSVLELASQLGHKEIVKVLVENGANLNLQHFITRLTPIISAASGGHKEIVEMLINKGADLHITATSTLLGQVCSQGWEDTAEILIQKGVDVNILANFGTTPLMKAVARGHTKLVEMLIKHGADVNMQEKIHLRQTALHYAKICKKKEIVQILIDADADLDKQNTLGNTALIDASEGGYTDIVEILIDAGANRFIKNQKQQTALDIAKGKEFRWKFGEFEKVKKYTEIIKLLEEQPGLLTKGAFKKTSSLLEDTSQNSNQEAPNKKKDDTASMTAGQEPNPDQPGEVSALGEEVGNLEITDQ